jgi:hypothetical protein
VERAVPGLWRRAGYERDAEKRQQGGVPLRFMRGWLPPDARRNGRSDVHGQPAGAQDRRARPPRAAVCGVLSPDLLGFRHRCSGRFRAADRGNRPRCGRAFTRRKGPSFAAAAGGVRDRHRPGDAWDAIPRREGRSDARTSEPVDRVRQVARAYRNRDCASRAAAPVAREPYGHPESCRDCGSPETSSTSFSVGAGLS